MTYLVLPGATSGASNSAGLCRFRRQCQSASTVTEMADQVDVTSIERISARHDWSIAKQGTVALPGFRGVVDAAVFVNDLLEGKDEPFAAFTATFQANDEGLTGYIDGDVFARILVEGALHLTAEEAEAMRKDADVRNNNQIAYNRWLKILTGRATQEQEEKWHQEQQRAFEVPNAPFSVKAVALTHI